MKIFVSYSRDAESAVQQLVGDLNALGHDAWFDQELSGGLEWWSAILEEIRRCDAFIAAVSPRALASLACKRETAYAGELGKPVLPVLVSANVSSAVLTPALSRIQLVEYAVPGDRASALKLARALGAVPAPTPLPDPLPQPPEPPVSRLMELRQQVESTTDLTFAEQSALLLELTQSLRDPEHRSSARALLELFRVRRDLRVQVAEEVARALSAPVEAEAQAPGDAGDRDEATNQSRTGVRRRTLLLCVCVAAALLFGWFANERWGPGATPSADPGARPPAQSASIPTTSGSPAAAKAADAPAGPTPEDLTVAAQEYAKGVAARKEDRNQEAEVYLTRAIGRDPKHVEALRLRCEIRVDLNKTYAGEDCAAAMAIKDDDPRIEVLYFAATRNTSPSKACAAASRAIELNPKYGPAYYARGLCAQYAGDEVEALTNFIDAGRYEPALWQAHYGAALMLYRLRRYVDAEPEATKAVTGSKGAAAAYDLRGFIRADMKRNSMALADFNRAIQLTPGDQRYQQNLAYLDANATHYGDSLGPRNEP